MSASRNSLRLVTCNEFTAMFPLLQGEVLLRSKEEQERILHACHIDATAGHMGKTRTICRIKERFMWHGIVKDVKELVSVVDNITLHNIYTCSC